MKIVRDGLWLCADCTIVACNGDASGIESDERAAEVEAGLDKLGPGLVPGKGHNEFSWGGCDCCGSPLGGERHEFLILAA